MPTLEERVATLEAFMLEVKTQVKLVKLILMTVGASLGIDLVQYL
jgi:hypothetical protein